MTDKNPILDDAALHASSVVANCAMNRERRCTGTNGYSYELKFDVLAYLLARRDQATVRWLDVCCGTGLALAEAATEIESRGDARRYVIEGIDLAGHFASSARAAGVVLRKLPIEAWDPSHTYDLVTCVHGLHYIGDKLGAIDRMANCLADDGIFLAHLDLANFRFPDGRPAGRTVAKNLKDVGVSYDNRHRLIRCEGPPGRCDLGWSYVGADDNVGPNYTGQPAVDSVYSR